MSWRDKLEPASWRDIPFKVASLNVTVGRKTIEHEIPFSNKSPIPEDLGIESEVFSIEAYVIQNAANDFDYFGERDALIDALKTEGLGILVHPTLGTFQCSLLGRATMRESFTNQQGIARFTMTFRVGEEIVFPETGSAVDELDAAADASTEANNDSLASKLAAAIAKVKDLAGKVGAVVDTVKDGLAMVQSAMSQIIGAIADAQTFIQDIKDTIDTIINLPNRLATQLSNSLSTFSGFIGDDGKADRSVLNATLAMSDFGTENLYSNGVPNVLGDSDSAETFRDAQTAVVDYYKTQGVIEAARIAVRVDYKSFEDALNTLGLIQSKIDDVLQAIGLTAEGDILFDAIEALRPALVKAMLAKGASLPKTNFFTVPVDVTPSVVIAFELFDDLSKEEELITRNLSKMIRPGFPDGGSELEVPVE